jgi:hypothetical protein
MRGMGLSEYCLQIDRIEIDELGGAVLSVENNRRQMTALTASRKEDFRRSLEEQYQLIARRWGAPATPGPTWHGSHELLKHSGSLRYSDTRAPAH